MLSEEEDKDMGGEKSYSSLEYSFAAAYERLGQQPQGQDWYKSSIYRIFGEDIQKALRTRNVKLILLAVEGWMNRPEFRKYSQKLESFVKLMELELNEQEAQAQCRMTLNFIEKIKNDQLKVSQRSVGRVSSVSTFSPISLVPLCSHSELQYPPIPNANRFYIDPLVHSVAYVAKLSLLIKYPW